MSIEYGPAKKTIAHEDGRWNILQNGEPLVRSTNKFIINKSIPSWAFFEIAFDTETCFLIP